MAAMDPVRMATTSDPHLALRFDGHEPCEAARALLETIERTPYTFASMSAFAGSLDPGSAVVETALRVAVAERRAEAFTRLFVACGIAGELPGAWVLAEGAALFTDMRILHRTALKLKGDVCGEVLKAVRSGRLPREREALLLELVWCWRETRGMGFDDEDLRKLQRRSAWENARMAESEMAIMLLQSVALLTDDDEMLRLLGCLPSDSDPSSPKDRLASELHRVAEEAIDWRGLVPATVEAEILEGGGTVRRTVPRVGRNDPCPCGSGRKFKKCCAGKESDTSQYEAVRAPIDLLAGSPETGLTLSDVWEMRSFQLFRLDVTQLDDTCLEAVLARLAVFRENVRVREMVEMVGTERITPRLWDDLAYEFVRARDIESLRWAATHFEDLPFDAEVLLAESAEAFRLVVEKIGEGHRLAVAGDIMARAAFTDAAVACMFVDPALALLVARGAIAHAESVHFDVLEDIVVEARIELGMTGEDPAMAWIDREYDREDVEWRVEGELEKQRRDSARRLAKREAETEALRKRIGSAREELERLERDARLARRSPSEATTAEREDTAIAEQLDELREQTRMLKSNLKQEHEERSREREKLRLAQAELRRLKSKPRRGREEERPTEAETEDAMLGESVAPLRSVRIPEFGDGFRRAGKRINERVVAGAVALAGRLAAGDEDAWRGTRKLKVFPEILRQKVARDFRLLFRVSSDAIDVVDLIDRKDLEGWIRRASSKG